MRHPAAFAFHASQTITPTPPILFPLLVPHPFLDLTDPMSTVLPILQQVQNLADTARVFGPISIKDGRLVCHAKAAAAPASYRLFLDSGKLWVSLVMADRWLSESIETDLLHTGDKMEDLLEEEMAEVGLKAGRPAIEHFRSDDLLFTFRTPLPVAPASPDAAPTAAKYLLAYEACFRNLGDMNAGD